MASPKGPFVSVQGKRLGLAPGFQYVDGAPTGPPLNVAASVVGNTATVTEQTLKSYALPEYALKSVNHGVLVQTSQVYGTLTSFTPPTTFVTAVGNVAALY